MPTPLVPDKPATQHAGRDQRFKLCNDGRIFDAEADVLEKTNLAGSTGAADPAARQRLQ
ncbi:MAG: hypothetical protein HZA89_07735 [Verrucomicrobia bacterium]|nr:hypothetical protein [Verrucomicrobiota bacterium]